MLGTDAASIPRWEAMLARMPPYLVELDGTLKEWAWPTLQERYAHRHVSHLYGSGRVTRSIRIGRRTWLGRRRSRAASGVLT